MELEVVDLTLPITPGMPVFPGDPSVGFECVSAADPGRRRFAVTCITLGSHTGTHLDAPAHICPGGAGAAQVPLAACVGPALVVDCTGLRRVGLAALRERVPDLPPGARLLLRTDWARHFGTDRYYQDFPGLSLAAARRLAERRLALLGLETPSVAVHTDHAAHVALLSAGVVLVEGLAHLRRIGDGACCFAALALPLDGRDGSPVRAVAWRLPIEVPG